MATTKRYRLRDPDMKVPMPDRGGRLFSAAGETVNVEDRFYATMIADGDLVDASQPAAPAGRGARSGLRPAADETETNAPSRRKGKRA